MSKITVNEQWKIDNGKYQCPYCKKEYSKKGISTHIWNSHTERGKSFRQSLNSSLKQTVPWNKGLNKLTDERLRVAGEKSSKALKGSIKISGNNNGMKKEESRLKLRNTMLLKYQSGFEVKCGKASKYSYNSPIAGVIKVDGTWELKVAQYLDSIGVSWKRNTERFEYINEQNKISTYCPDFYVLDWDCFIEVKGYKTIKDDLKWKQFPFKLEVWDKSKLKELKLL